MDQNVLLQELIENNLNFMAHPQIKSIIYDHQLLINIGFIYLLKNMVFY